MANKIKGITLEIGGDTTLLNKSFSEANKKSKDLQSELKQVDRLLKLDPGNAVLVAQKQKILAEAVKSTSDKLDSLREAEKKAQQQFKEGKVSEEQYRYLQREIVKTEQELKGLENQGKKTSKSLSQGLEEAGSKVTSLGQKASIASAAIVAGVGAAAKSALDSADNYVKLADETGMSLETLQEYSYVGGQVGVELETIAGAQAKLTKSMTAAKKGTGSQAEAFKALGISIVDSNGQLRDAKVVMGEAMNALSGVGNETERDSLSMQIFGKSAMELNPLIKLGADGIADMRQKAHDLGIVLSDESIIAMDDFGDSAEGLKMSVTSAIGGALVPFIQKLTEFANWFSSLDTGTKNAILGVALFVAAIGPLLIVLGSTITAIGTITGALGAMTGAITLATLASKAETVALMAMYAADYAAAGALKIVTAAQAAFNLVMSLNPIAKVIIALGLLATAISLVVTHWETICKWIEKAWNWLQKWNNTPMKSKVGSVTTNYSMPVGNNADGTDYWPGGLSWVGENGPEILNIPRGSQIIPNNKIGQLLNSQANQQTNINIVINNPIPEKSADSVSKSLTRLGYMGVI